MSRQHQQTLCSTYQHDTQSYFLGTILQCYQRPSSVQGSRWLIRWMCSLQTSGYRQHAKDLSAPRKRSKSEALEKQPLLSQEDAPPTPMNDKVSGAWFDPLRWITGHTWNIFLRPISALAQHTTTKSSTNCPPVAHWLPSVRAKQHPQQVTVDDNAAGTAYVEQQ